MTEPGTYVGASGFGGYPTVANLPDEFMTIASGAIPVFYIDVYRFDTPDDMEMSANHLIQKLYPMYENGIGRAYIRRGSIASGAQWGDWFGIGVPQVAGNSEVGYVLQVKDNYGNIEWGQAPQPDMTGVVKTDEYGTVISGGSTSDLIVSNGAYNSIKMRTSSFPVIQVRSNDDSVAMGLSGPSAFISISIGNKAIGMEASAAGQSLIFGDKNVTITDAISDAPAGNALVTDKAVADYVDSHGGGGAAVCELTLSGDGTVNATFIYQGLDGTFSYEALMDGSKHETVVTVPVGSVVRVAYSNEPGVWVSSVWAYLIADGGTSIQSVDFYQVGNTSASIAVKGPSAVVP